MMQETVHTANSYQNLRLHEWIALGRESGLINNVNTVLLAYCMDERDAMPWIADIVNGNTTESKAIVFMERAVMSAHYAVSM